MKKSLKIFIFAGSGVILCVIAIVLAVILSKPKEQAGIYGESKITLMKSETFYYLDGITAYNSKGNSIKHKITITISDGGTEENGKIIFEDLGVYAIYYTVYDNTVQKTYNKTLIVTVVDD
ncbi:MAG: hypothetical protein GX794_04010 [Acholeplasmataceae bacterium]|nr:hypothetical protein [Acholeplasmataceae bacterium]